MRLCNEKWLKNTYKQNSYQNLAFVSSLQTNYARNWWRHENVSLSHEYVETAVILMKDCFAAWESLAALFIVRFTGKKL